MSPTNNRVRLAARPVGEPKRTDFTFDQVAVEAPAAGEVLVKVLYVSLDPAMRGWMREGRSYVPPVGIGEVMRAGAVGRVVQSNDPKLKEGDHVVGMLGVQEYALQPAKALTPVDPKLAPLPLYLSALGMPGMTAYFGLLDVGQPKPGETVVVSGAAGAVGALVGQIAKIKGCRAIGIAGGEDKCDYLTKTLGFDAAIDYKRPGLAEALAQHCPKGLDVYFDNVGGDILDACLSRLAMKARIVICGAISQYNATGVVKGPANYMALLVARARMEGMLVSDYAARFGEGAAAMAGWLKAGTLKSREDVVFGLQTFPETLNKLFKGENFGKLVLQVAEA